MADKSMACRKPTREMIKTFFSTGTAMMKSDETRQLLQDPDIPKPGMKLIEMQRAGWDPLGVDRDYGCNCLDKIEEDFPGDQEMMEMKLDFIHTASRTFLKSLVDRAPSKLETKKKIPRDTIIQFFEACNTQMGVPEFQERLARHMEEQKSPPNGIIVEMQRSMLELFGFEKEHGCRMLSNISKDYPGDNELFANFQRWSGVAKQTCMNLMRQHMAAQGPCLNQQFEDNPQMQEMRSKAEEQIEGMSPEERSRVVETMQKKIAVFAGLPHEAKVSYMKKLSEDDRLEFVKGQILLSNMMSEQWQKQQGTNKAATEGSKPNAEQPSGSSPAPPQQQMM